jgi:hypothetical protein
VPSESGLATAETAVALPAIVVLVAGSLTLPVALAAQLRATDAAREAARAAARGDDGAAVQAAVAAIDRSAHVTLRRGDGLIHAEVAVRARLPLLPPWEVSATATTADEGTPGADGSADP